MFSSSVVFQLPHFFFVLNHKNVYFITILTIRYTLQVKEDLHLNTDTMFSDIDRKVTRNIVQKKNKNTFACFSIRQFFFSIQIEKGVFSKCLC